MDTGIPLTPMKLQKLVYYAHGWNLALTGKPLINENIGAWPYGPVIGSLYKEFKAFGRQKIDSLAIDKEGNTFSINENDELTFQLLSKVWETYSKLTAVELSNATHASGSPWSECYQEGHSNTIDNENIKQYFLKLARENAQG
jgi:uncharacterized phage-associated protein